MTKIRDLIEALNEVKSTEVVSKSIGGSTSKFMRALDRERRLHGVHVKADDDKDTKGASKAKAILKRVKYS